MFKAANLPLSSSLNSRIAAYLPSVDHDLASRQINPIHIVKYIFKAHFKYRPNTYAHVSAL